MIENSRVYEQIGKVIWDDPLGFIDNQINLSQPKLSSESGKTPSLEEVLNLCGRFEGLELVYDRGDGGFFCEEIDGQAAESSETKGELKEATCDFCGFTGSRYFYSLIPSDKVADGFPKSTACTLCSLVVRPAFSIKCEAALFALMPEFSQAGLIRLMRDIYVLRLRGATGERARRAFQLVKMRCDATENKFGAVDSDDLRSILSKNLAHRFGIRLVPRDRLIAQEAGLEFNKFPQILAYWRRDDQPYAFKNLVEAEKRVEVFLNYEEARLDSLGVDVKVLYSDELASESPVQSKYQNLDVDFEETLQAGRENYENGDFPAAEESLRKSLVVGHNEFGDAHVKLASLYSWLAAALDSQSKREVAEAMHRRAVEMAERVSGPKDSSTQNYRLNLAVNLQFQDRYSEAKEIHKRRVHYLEKSSDGSLVQLANALYLLGRNLQHQEKLAEAIEMLAKSVDFFSQELGVQSKEAVWGRLAVADCFAEGFHWERASKAYDEVNTVSETAFLQSPKDRGDILVSIALFFDKFGSHEESERFFREALTVYPSDAELAILRRIDLRKYLAQSLIRLGEFTEARQELEVCQIDLSVHALNDKWRVSDANSLLAHARHLSGEYLETTEIHEAALRDLKTNWGENHNIVASAKLLLAENLRLRKDVQAAKKLCESVISSTPNIRQSNTLLGRAHFRLAMVAQDEADFATNNIDCALGFYALSVGERHTWFKEAKSLRELILTRRI